MRSAFELLVGNAPAADAEVTSSWRGGLATTEPVWGGSALLHALLSRALCKCIGVNDDGLVEPLLPHKEACASLGVLTQLLDVCSTRRDRSSPARRRRRDEIELEGVEEQELRAHRRHHHQEAEAEALPTAALQHQQVEEKQEEGEEEEVPYSALCVAAAKLCERYALTNERTSKQILFGADLNAESFADTVRLHERTIALLLVELLASQPTFPVDGEHAEISRRMLSQVVTSLDQQGAEGVCNASDNFEAKLLKNLGRPTSLSNVTMDLLSLVPDAFFPLGVQHPEKQPAVSIGVAPVKKRRKGRLAVAVPHPVTPATVLLTSRAHHERFHASLRLSIEGRRRRQNSSPPSQLTLGPVGSFTPNPVMPSASPPNNEVSRSSAGGCQIPEGPSSISSDHGKPPRVVDNALAARAAEVEFKLTHRICPSPFDDRRDRTRLRRTVLSPFETRHHADLNGPVRVATPAALAGCAASLECPKTIAAVDMEVLNVMAYRERYEKQIAAAAHAFPPLTSSQQQPQPQPAMALLPSAQPVLQGDDLQENPKSPLTKTNLRKLHLPADRQVELLPLPTSGALSPSATTATTRDDEDELLVFPQNPAKIVDEWFEQSGPPQIPPPLQQPLSNGQSHTALLPGQFLHSTVVSAGTLMNRMLRKYATTGLSEGHFGTLMLDHEEPPSPPPPPLLVPHIIPDDDRVIISRVSQRPPLPHHRALGETIPVSKITVETKVGVKRSTAGPLQPEEASSLASHLVRTNPILLKKFGGSEHYRQATTKVAHPKPTTGAEDARLQAMELLMQRVCLRQARRPPPASGFRSSSSLH